MIRLFLLIFICILSSPVLAQSAEKQAATRIEADEKSGIVRIFIEDRVVAQFTSSGLKVIGDIAYTGGIKDVGGAHADVPARVQDPARTEGNGAP